MNLRTYVTMSATAMLLLGGCIIVGDPNANGGAGGTGGEGVGNRGNNGGNGGGVSTGGNGGAGVGGAAGMGMGGKGGSGGSGVGGTAGMGMGGGGMGGGPTCAMTCGEALADGVEVCAANTASRMLYDNLNMCTCVNTATSTPPGCKEKCDANLCTTGTPDQACQDCVGDSVNGCGVAFAACSNDA